MHEVDETTEYLDSSDYQKQRHRGMLKLAQRLEPGELPGAGMMGPGRAE